MKNIDRGIEAATGLWPTGFAIGASTVSAYADPGTIASWAGAIAACLFVLIQLVRLARELVGWRKDRKEARDAE